ncbi:MAG: serine/threonine-protein kinase, partial [Pseudohongiella sp.]
ALFSELIALELSYRRRTHHATPLQQSYYTRFPQYKDIIDEAYSEQGIPQPDKTERVIDGYLLQRQLGRGGMGVVYQALDLHLNRTVALKMLSADCISGEQLSRFQTESRVLAKLDHHNVLKIHAVGYWHDQPYLVLEYADGGSLADRLAQGPLGLQDTLQLMTALVDAVTFLHEQTLIHRDLKPSNILFTQDGTVKIADFGLVRDSFSDACHTHADSQLGTPAYMAPEQLNADMGVASPASDIFSLGAIMHHMLTGTVPYAGLAVSDMVSALSSQRPVPVQHLQQGGIPASFARICRRCLKKEPAQRYPSAAALSADLQRLQQGLRISPLPLFWQSVLGQSRKLAATVAVFVLGAVLMASFQYSATDTEPGFMSSERLGRLPPETLALLREGTAVENASVDNTSTENSPLAMTLLDGNTLPGVSLKAPLGLALHDERYLA